MKEFLEISKENLKLSICTPGTYYQGVRFDWCGVFRSIELNGFKFADEWFDSNDPLRHDRVCGCTEEVMPVWLPGGRCLKIGVGILDVRKEEYDWFKLYPIVDAGEMSMEQNEDSITFRHIVRGCYEYAKKIIVTGPNEFEIRHLLKAVIPIDTTAYCHNFFTFGRDEVDSDRSVSFASSDFGHWRPDSVHAYIKGNDIRLDGRIMPGEKAYMGDIGAKEYRIRVRDGFRSVEIRSEENLHHTVFWSNDRVACAEPYVGIRLGSGECKEWSVRYTLFV